MSLIHQPVTNPYDPKVTVHDCDAALARLSQRLGRVDAEDRPRIQDEADKWLDRRFGLTALAALDRPPT